MNQDTNASLPTQTGPSEQPGDQEHHFPGAGYQAPPPGPPGQPDPQQPPHLPAEAAHLDEIARTLKTDSPPLHHHAPIPSGAKPLPHHLAPGKLEGSKNGKYRTAADEAAAAALLLEIRTTLSGDGKGDPGTTTNGNHGHHSNHFTAADPALQKETKGEHKRGGSGGGGALFNTVVGNHPVTNNTTTTTRDDSSTGTRLRRSNRRGSSADAPGAGVARYREEEGGSEEQDEDKYDDDNDVDVDDIEEYKGKAGGGARDSKKKHSKVLRVKSSAGNNHGSARGSVAAGAAGGSNNASQKSELTLLCEKFQYQFGHLQADGSPSTLMLNDIVQALGVPRRRLYDVINVFESIDVMKRTGKLQYEFCGYDHLPALFTQLAEEEEAGVPVEDRGRKTLKDPPATRTAGGAGAAREKSTNRKDFNSNNNKQSAAAAIEDPDAAPATGTAAAAAAEEGGNGSAQEVHIDANPNTNTTNNNNGNGNSNSAPSSHSLWVLSRRLVRMLLSSSDPIYLSGAASILVGPTGVPDATHTRTQTQITVERRLYDIGSILCSVGLVERVYLKKRQPAFEWIYGWRPKDGGNQEPPELAVAKQSRRPAPPLPPAAVQSTEKLRQGGGRGGGRKGGMKRGNTGQGGGEYHHADEKRRKTDLGHDDDDNNHSSDGDGGFNGQELPFGHGGVGGQMNGLINPYFPGAAVNPLTGAPMPLDGGAAAGFEFANPQVAAARSFAAMGMGGMMAAAQQNPMYGNFAAMGLMPGGLPVPGMVNPLVVNPMVNPMMAAAAAYGASSMVLPGIDAYTQQQHQQQQHRGANKDDQNLPPSPTPPAPPVWPAPVSYMPPYYTNPAAAAAAAAAAQAASAAAFYANAAAAANPLQMQMQMAAAAAAASQGVPQTLPVGQVGSSPTGGQTARPVGSGQQQRSDDERQAEDPRMNQELPLEESFQQQYQQQVGMPFMAVPGILPHGNPAAVAATTTVLAGVMNSLHSAIPPPGAAFSPHIPAPIPGVMDPAAVAAMQARAMMWPGAVAAAAMMGQVHPPSPVGVALPPVGGLAVEGSNAAGSGVVGLTPTAMPGAGIPPPGP